MSSRWVFWSVFLLVLVGYASLAGALFSQDTSQASKSVSDHDVGILRTPPMPINYLIVCEDDYRSLAWSHAEVVESHPDFGHLNVDVRTLSDIRWAYGSSDSTAVRRLIRDLWSWGLGRLRYVLLVGYRVPAYKFVPRKAPLKRWQERVFFDDPYGDVDDDGELEVMVGRVNCTTVEQFARWSSKVCAMLAMAANNDPDFYHSVLVLAEDGMINDEDGGYVRWWGRKLSLTKLPGYGADATCFFATDIDPNLDPQVLQNHALRHFNSAAYNIVIGIGTYASMYDLVDFFSTQYAYLTESMLENVDAYPVVLGFCCQTACWDSIANDYPKVMDVMNFAQNAGTILWIGPTAITIQAHSEMLLDELLERVFDRTGQFKTWGEAFISAKNEMKMKLFSENEIWWSYTLIGEPSLPLKYGPWIVCGAEKVAEAKPPTVVVAGSPVVFAPARFVVISPKQTDCSVEVFDVQGRLVARVFEGELTPGTNVVQWDGRSQLGNRVSPGVYIVRVASSTGSAMTKVVVLR